jgi:tetratricopeptide (TPR) repeat protein
MKSLTAALGCLALTAASAAAAQNLPPNHPPIGAGASSEELMKEIDGAQDLRSRDKPFEVALSMGRLYYGNGRFQDAVVFLGQAMEKSEGMRKLYLGARAKAPGQLPASDAACSSSDPLEKKLQLASKQPPAAAAACALAALKPVLEGQKMLANARFLTRDPSGALSEYERVLKVSPDDPEALFAHASVLFETRPDDVKALARAKSEWEKSVAIAPGSPRAARTRKLIAHADEVIAAGGVSSMEKKQVAEARARPVAAAAPHPTGPFAGGAMGAPNSGGPNNEAPPQLSQQTMEAMQRTEVTPEMQQRFGTLVEEGEEHLARGRFQEALDNFKQVMPFQPENARLRAGMAWALVGLKRQPMADRIWGVAVSTDPSAVDALGKILQSKGDSKGAKSLWMKLAESDPTYAQKAGLSARLER